MFSCRNAHSGKDVEPRGHSALGGRTFVVDHLLQHLGIRLIALGHHTYLVMARFLELRTDTRLLIANLFQRRDNLTHRLVVAQQLAQVLNARLRHFCLHVQHAQVVGLSHEEGDEVVQLVVLSLQRLIVIQHIGHDDGLIHLVGIVHAHRGALQPHHTTEVALQRIRAAVVPTRTVQTVGIRDFAHIVHQQLAGTVHSLHHACYLPLLQVLSHAALYRLSRKQVPGNVVELHVTIGSTREVAVVGCPCIDLAHSLKHVVREVGHQRHQMLLLQFAQHAVEVEVIELQEEVGGDKRGEALVVVLLIDVEQLFVLCRHNGKALVCQLLTEQ